MSTVLDEICGKKRAHVAAQKESVPLPELILAIQNQSLPRGFIQSLKKSLSEGRYGLIAEVKKASPSKGVIRKDFDPVAIAQAYERAGASCISVLTDIPYFQGADDYLKQARAATSLPVLRKDFMVDPYQMFEARALGADCILLIMAALDDELAHELESLAHELGMDVLIEVHNQDELDRALKMKSPLVGINNRNLKTLNVDINTSVVLTETLPEDKIIVSESGLAGPEVLKTLSDKGINCFLIGESLMRQDDVEAATKEILRKA